MSGSPMGIVCPHCRAARVPGGRRCPNCQAFVPAPASSSIFGRVVYVCAFVAASWGVREYLRDPLSPRPPSYTAAATAEPKAVAPAVWTDVDLYDLALRMPSSPVLSESMEVVAGTSAKVRKYKSKRSENAIVEAHVIDYSALGGCNTVGAVDGAAKGAIDGLRGTEGVRDVEVTTDERRFLGGMPGRFTEVRPVATRSGGPHLAIRSAFFGKGCRIYAIMALSADVASVDEAKIVLASIHATARATPPAGARAAVVPPPSWASHDGTEAVTPYNTIYKQMAPQPTGLPATWETEPPVDYGSPVPVEHGPVHVRGYTRGDGTYVQPHTRSAPHR